MVLPFYVGRMLYEGEYLTIDGCRTLLFSVALVFYAISFGMKGGQSYHHLLWLATFVFSIFCSMTSRHCTTIVVSSILPHFRIYNMWAYLCFWLYDFGIDSIINWIELSIFRVTWEGSHWICEFILLGQLIFL